MIRDLVRIDMEYPGRFGGTAYETHIDLYPDELEKFRPQLITGGFHVQYRIHNGRMHLYAQQGDAVPERIVTPGYQESFRSKDSVSVTKYHPGRIPEHAYRWLE